MNARRRWIVLGAGAFVASAGACTSILGIDPPPSPTGPAQTSDAGRGGSPATCPSADAGDGTSYTPFEPASSAWQVVTLPDVGASGYQGGCFANGAYYLATPTDRVARFTVNAGGQVLTGESVATGAQNGAFAGTCFDGRYVYFTPSAGGSIGRFDSSPGAPFVADAGEWFGFDASAPGTHFFGCAFDTKTDALYLAPGPFSTPGPSGVVARFDVAGGAFTSPSAWSTFDVGTLNPEARGFAGAVVTDAGVVFVPEENNAFDGGVNHGHSGTVALFNGSTQLDAKNDWSTFDTTAVSGDATNFYGGAFDGRYVYLVPRSSTAVATRVDTMTIPDMPISKVALWEHYDLTRLPLALATGAGGYQGAGFDGRYVYFAPDGNGSLVVVRYDTHADFEADCAWSTVDLAMIPGVDAGSLKAGFAGVIFDGEYVSFVPGKGNTALVRFQACTKCQALTFPFPGGSFL